MKTFRFLSTLVVLTTQGFVLSVPGETYLEDWSRNPALSAESNLLALHYGGSPLVAVGRNGSIVTSVDGRDWTVRDSGTSVDLGAVTYGNGRYLALTEDSWESDPVSAGTMVTSPDGVHWTVRDSGLSLQRAVSAQEKFVAAGESGIYISDDGLNWSQVYDEPMEDVAYDRGRFAAVGGETFLVSADGLAWQALEGFSVIEHDHLFTVEVMGDRLVAVGSNGWIKHVYTIDGDGELSVRDFEPSSDPPFGVIIRREGDRALVWSQNNNRHRVVDLSRVDLEFTCDKPVPFNDLVYSRLGFLAVGEGLSIWYNDGFRAWRENCLLPPSDDWEEQLTSTGWNGAILGMETASGTTVLGGEEGQIATTADGVRWTLRGTGAATSFRAVAYHADRWLAFGEDGSVWSSEDAAVWTEGPSFGSASFTAAASGEGAVAAVGGDGSVRVSENGVDWNTVASGTANALNGVAYGAGRFVAVGNSGSIVSSENGQDWTEVASPVEAPLRSVAYGGGGFVAVGDTGAVVTSENGVDWVERDSVGNSSLVGIASGEGYFVAIDQEPDPEALLERNVWVSPDGVAWEERTMGRRKAVSAVGFGHGGFLLGGADGMLYSSLVAEISPGSAQVESQGESYGIEVSGAAWTVSSHPDWVVVDPITGEGDSTLGIDVEENREIQDRSGSVVVGGQSHFIHQTGAGHRVNARASGRGEVIVDPDPGGERVPPGSTITLEAEPAREFLGWSIAGFEASDETSFTIELNADVDAIAHFRDETHLFGIAAFGDEVYAAGRGGTILAPRAGSLWGNMLAGADYESWRGLAANGETLVGVGRNGGMAVSDDGRDWRVLWGGGGSEMMNSVTVASNEFWATGDGGKLMRSRDGLLWDTFFTGTIAELRALAHDPVEDRYVVVGEAGTIVTSVGGEDWAVQDSGEVWDLLDVTFGSDDFAAVTADGLVVRSPDGTSWTALPEPLDRDALGAVAFGNERYVVAGGLGRDSVLFVSEDLESWQEVELPLPTVVTELLFEGGRFLAAGYFGTVLESENGFDWDVLHTGLNTDFFAVAEDDSGDRIAVGEHGQVHRPAADGSWERLRISNSSWLVDVAFGDGTWVAVGEWGTVLYSTDGENWEKIGVSGEDVRLNGVVFGGGRFVAVGENGTVLVSEDGQTWTAGSLPGERSYGSVAYGAGRFVAVGENAAAVSVDGLAWEETIFEEYVDLRAVVFHENGRFVAGGSQFQFHNGEVVVELAGWTAHSPDGAVWTISPPEPGYSWETAASGTGWVAAFGLHGEMGLSSDGDEWVAEEPPSPGDAPLHPAWLNDAIIGSDGATVVGSGGMTHLVPLPPLIVEHSGDVTVDPLEDIVLSAESKGTGPFAYQWFYDGMELEGETAPVLHLSDAERDAIGDYRLRVTGPGGKATSAPFFVVVRTNYDAWVAEHFDESSATEEVDRSADPENVGVRNLLAYAFDAEPHSARTFLPVAGVERLEVDGEARDYPTLTFSRSIGAGDVEYFPEISNDLHVWSPLPSEQVVRTWREGTREFVTVRDQAPIGEGNALRFFRLRVMENE